ncbi:DUF6506 family protein [Conexibacter woesei]|uniref:Uncharacterized protein n=1 Tax=Conexibacter woesei (strain DSM 14684 / CCUG 47730 / CIP 108061 / JCM 11494 / NBRC 100937 / ID131577) TaxID=469383 RepID=D3F9Q7_CONWI|nr:DUF6506 family protein [Conexibacter woesei]ADB51119.1 hypothetical protein Cwoe_2700 [Conexibacter woesei DSM 14684]
MAATPSFKAAFLYLAAGADPAVDRVVRDGQIERSTIVAVPDAETAGRVAAELERDGLDLIELYGGLGQRGAAAVVEATGGRVPVGYVGYDADGSGAGPDAGVRHRVIVYEETGADPTGERVVSEHGGVRTTVVAVPDAERVPPIAAELVGEGAERVEICGGLGPVPAARTVAEIGGRVPVGAVLFGAESLQLVAAFQAGFAETAS